MTYLNGENHPSIPLSLTGSQGLAQSLSKLSESEAETLRQLSGGSLEVWESLAQEGNSTLFFSDLYTYAQSLEESASPQLAMSTYQALAQSESAPQGIRDRAQHRLTLLDGGGSMGDQFELSASRLMDEVTAPELLIGMGVGSLTYGFSRFASAQTLHRLGMGSRTIRWGSRAMGLGAESAAFVSASHGVQVIRGHRPLNPFHHQFGSEWLHTLGMLATLRGVGWGIKGWYGSGATRLSGWHGSLAQVGHQTAMGLGLAAFHLGEAHFSGQELPLNRLISQTLAELLVFQGAGQLSRRLWGPRLTALEQRLDGMSQGIERPQTLLPALEGFSGPQWASAEGAIPHSLMMASHGEGPGGKGERNAEMRLPLIPRGRKGRDPSFPQRFSSDALLLAHLRDAKNLDVLLSDHAYWLLAEPGKLTAPQVRDLLNAYPRLPDIPRGRLVSLRFQDGTAAFEYQYVRNQFFTKRRNTGLRVRARTSTPPESEPPPDSGKRPASRTPSSEDLRDVVRRMDAIAHRDTDPDMKAVGERRSPTGARKRSRTLIGIPTPENMVADQGLRLIYSEGAFQAFLKRSKELFQSQDAVDVYLTLKKTMGERELRILTNYVSAYPEASILRIHEEASKKSYHLQQMSQGPKVFIRRWLPPSARQEIRTNNLLELFQHLSFYRDHRPDAMYSAINVWWSGSWDPQFHTRAISEHFNAQTRYHYRQVNFQFIDPQKPATVDPGQIMTLLRGTSGMYFWRRSQ